MGPWVLSALKSGTVSPRRHGMLAAARRRWQWVEAAAPAVGGGAGGEGPTAAGRERPGAGGPRVQLLAACKRPLAGRQALQQQGPTAPPACIARGCAAAGLTQEDAGQCRAPPVPPPVCGRREPALRRRCAGWDWAGQSERHIHQLAWITCVVVAPASCCRLWLARVMPPARMAHRWWRCGDDRVVQRCRVVAASHRS